MSSKTRQQLEEWIKTKSVVGRVLDVGGAQQSIRDRVHFAGETEIYTLDLPTPHEAKEPVQLEWDMNRCMYSEFNAHDAFERRDLFGSFDFAVCLEVTEYLWNPVCAMKNLALMLKEGGRLFISFHFIYPVHNPAKLDFLRYTSAGARKLLEEAGFEIVEETPRVASGSDFVEAFLQEGMRPARGYEHTIIGSLIEAKKKNHMASKNKQILQSRPEEWRRFTYSHGNVNIKIDLRVDVKDQLMSGRIIAEKFTADIDEALSKLNNK